MLGDIWFEDPESSPYKMIAKVPYYYFATRESWHTYMWMFRLADFGKPSCSRSSPANHYLAIRLEKASEARILAEILAFSVLRFDYYK